MGTVIPNNKVYNKLLCKAVKAYRSRFLADARGQRGKNWTFDDAYGTVESITQRRQRERVSERNVVSNVIMTKAVEARRRRMEEASRPYKKSTWSQPMDWHKGRAKTIRSSKEFWAEMHRILDSPEGTELEEVLLGKKTLVGTEEVDLSYLLDRQSTKEKQVAFVKKAVQLGATHLLMTDNDWLRTLNKVKEEMVMAVDTGILGRITMMKPWAVIVVEDPTLKEAEDGGVPKIILGPVYVIADNKENAVATALSEASLTMKPGKMRVFAIPFE